jgi:hypothetical protein
MSAPLSPETVRTIARLATASGRHVRFAMRGSSMLPLLREPMILEVAPLTPRTRVGDVIVFACGDIQVAHRVIRYDGVRYLTSGDAQPLVIEEVGPADILGRVECVWQNAAASARRVDVGAHRLRGWWYANAHPVRARAAGARALAKRTIHRVMRLARRGQTNA